MKQIVKFIPNLLTLGNLFMGLLALVFIAREQMVSAVLCVAVALILDFLDGFAARLLHAEGEMGKQLDSLADLVTFGVVPGFMLFQMIIITQGYYFVDVASWPIPVFLNAAIAGLVPLAGALRLARYNLDSGHTDHFLGMPIPAMSMFVFGIPIILEMQYHLNFYHPLSNQFIAILGEARRWDPSDILIVKMMFNTLFYQVLSVILAALMVSRIPMLSLKFKRLSWGKNKWSYGIIIWLAIAYLIFVIPYLGGYGLIDYLIIPIIMIGYFILSLIYATFGNQKKEHNQMKFKAEIDVMPHDNLLDPQGKAVSATMVNLGLNEIQNARIGKHIQLHVEAPNAEVAKEKVDQACRKLLCNMIMESYSFELVEA